MALPSAYKEVEWIQNSWTQRINTWLYPSSNMTVQMKFINTAYWWMNLFWYNNAETDSFRFFRANDTTYLDYWSWNNYNRISWTYITSTSDIYEVEFWNRYVKDIPTDTIKFSWTAVSFWEKSMNAYIFWNRDNTPDYMKLYYCKIYVSWTLVRDYVPCYRKSDNVTWMYDLVNDQFYTNAWTWTFIRGPIKDRWIPDDYTLVECIESTATNPWTTSSSWQYIDTLYTHNPNTKIEIDLQFTTTSVQQRLFWSETTNSSYSTFSAYINWSWKWARATKDWEWNWQSTEVTADTNRHTYVLDKTTYSIYTNWTQIHSWSNAYTITKNGTHSLLLLACYNDSTAQSIMEHASAKLYSCKIWDNWTLYRDMVPVIRNSDNKPGMYDIVTDTFYTNAGTGEFNYKKYPESWQIQHIYLAQNLIYPPQPSEITIEYTNLPVWTAVNAQKDWYKVKQVIFYWEWYYSWSEWKNGWMNLYDDVTTRTNLHVNIQLWGTWGYDYWNWWAYNWYWVERTNQTAQAIIKWNSWCANSHNFYVKFITNKDTTEYKFGTSSSNITQSGTATHSATVQQWITDLFNWTNLKVSRNAWWNEDWFTVGYKITVVYEQV